MKEPQEVAYLVLVWLLTGKHNQGKLVPAAKAGNAPRTFDKKENLKVFLEFLKKMWLIEYQIVTKHQASS